MSEGPALAPIYIDTCGILCGKTAAQISPFDFLGDDVKCIRFRKYTTIGFTTKCRFQEDLHKHIGEVYQHNTLGIWYEKPMREDVQTGF